MELSKEEIEQIELMVDAAFLKLCGRTYNDEDMRRAKIPHAERNGDSSHQRDTWQKIKHDFPDLFGGKQADAP
jgi:hypothetical protein